MRPLVGIGYRPRYREALLAVPETDGLVLEIMASHFFRRPEEVRPLADRFPIVLHDVVSSLGTFGGSERERLVTERLREIVDYTRPLFFTEHLAFTRSPDGVDLGHLCPLWLTHEMLDALTYRLKALTESLEVPILLENIANPFIVPDADFTEAGFLEELTSRTGTGLLLDLSNLAANAANFGFDARRELAAYPLERVEAVHLAGAVTKRGFRFDSHDQPVDDASYSLLGALASRAPVRTIVVERDGNLPPLGDLLAEARRAGALFEASSSPLALGAA